MYSALNSFSFALVTGNTITLYALALGANSTVVGLLSAFMSLSFFAIPLGKLAIKRFSLVRVFAHFWMLRNWSLLPLAAIPLLMAAGYSYAAITLLLVCVFLFNLFRGVGLIANNPVISTLAPGKERGEYIVRLSLINNATALLSTLLLAWLLSFNEGLETYNLVILLGIVSGLGASALLFRLPEPGGFSVPEHTGGGFIRSVRTAVRESNFRRYMVSYVVLGFGMGMARPFITVFSKEVYGQSDSLVTIFTVCSSLGALLMGSVMRLVIDRLGAKPMYIIFAGISFFSLLPALIAPGIGSGLFAFGFLCVLAAVTNMGFAGQESASQAYFFAMIPRDAVLDLSMLYYFALGGTGAIASVAGGALLDFLSAVGLSSLASFRLFFLISLLLTGVGFRLQQGLQDMGSYPVKETLAVLFSPRDMRALTLLRKLDITENPERETEIIAELGEVASEVSVEVLLDHLSSPRWAVRYEALQSVSSLKRLNGRMREALLAELQTGLFSTAALAARLLGEFTVHQAAPLLRSSLDSPDYRLAGESMLALARLGDQRAQFLVSDRLLQTDNPFILIRGIQSMETYGTAASIPILLDLLRNEHLPDHISDETILVLSALLAVPKKFFYVFEKYVRNRESARNLIADTVDEFFARRKREDAALADVLQRFMGDPSADSDFVRWVLDFGRGHTGVYSALLVSVALDADLKKLESFRFFLCFWAAAVFANPSLIEK